MTFRPLGALLHCQFEREHVHGNEVFWSVATPRNRAAEACEVLFSTSLLLHVVVPSMLAAG